MPPKLGYKPSDFGLAACWQPDTQLTVPMPLALVGTMTNRCGEVIRQNISLANGKKYSLELISLFHKPILACLS